MIGHDVQNQAHSALSQTSRELGELFLRADFRIESGMIGDVVTVRTALPCSEQRRSIAIADAEIIQVWRQPRRPPESKSRIELHAVSGRRNARPNCGCPILQ